MSTNSKTSPMDFEKEIGANVSTRTGTAVSNRKPMLLSSQRFNKIVNNAKSTDRSKSLAEAEVERKNKEKLKLGSDELVAQFKGSLQRTQEQKLHQIKEQRDNKIKQAVANYEQAKENETQKRRDKIAKAEQIIERDKPGPRELHSAVLQSEVLRARNVQRTINEEFEKAIVKQQNEAKMICNEQALKWIEEDQQRLKEREMNTIAYKNELLQTINENQRKRCEQKKQTVREQQAARDEIDMETKAQIEKEKSVMEKKKEALRKNALEAMKMVEQRRLRDHMVENVEARLCCVYKAGKSQLDAQLFKQSQKLDDEQQRKMSAEVKKLNNMQENSAALESDRIKRDITTMQLKFTAEEQEKVRKDKAAKQARIEAYLREMQQQKEMQRAMEEEKRFEIAERLRNAEVNCLFAEKQREQTVRQFQKVRTHLNQQIEDNKRKQMIQKQAALVASHQTNDKDHAFFFEYARNLVEDAQEKGRPLYPFVKAINNYKRENYIDCQRKVPKHLQSNLSIGRNNIQRRSSEELNEKDKQNSTDESILQNCLKINEIVKAASNKPNTKEKVENEQAGNRETCNTIRCPSPSQTIRYSMDKLKKLNQFSSPTCH